MSLTPTPDGAAAGGPVDPDETPRERVDRMQRDNDAALQALAQRGVQVDQASLNQVRLVFLIEHTLGDMDTDKRLDYELAVQTRFAQLIAEIQAQVTRAVLLNGVNGVNTARPGLGG